MQEDFGIGLGTKGGSAGFKVAPKFKVVVNFPVKDEVPATIGGGHGLGPAGKVEQTEATVAEAHGGIGVGAVGVGTTMGESIGHSGKSNLGLIRGVTMGGKSGEAAHRGIGSGTRGKVSSEEVKANEVEGEGLGLDLSLEGRVASSADGAKDFEVGSMGFTYFGAGSGFSFFGFVWSFRAGRGKICADWPRNGGDGGLSRTPLKWD